MPSERQARTKDELISTLQAYNKTLDKWLSRYKQVTVSELTTEQIGILTDKINEHSTLMPEKYSAVVKDIDALKLDSGSSDDRVFDQLCGEFDTKKDELLAIFDRLRPEIAKATQDKKAPALPEVGPPERKRKQSRPRIYKTALKGSQQQDDIEELITPDAEALPEQREGADSDEKYALFVRDVSPIIRDVREPMAKAGDLSKEINGYLKKQRDHIYQDDLAEFSTQIREVLKQLLSFRAQLKERLDSVAHLGVETGKYNSTHEELNRLVELLSEKSGLLSVTGHTAKKRPSSRSTAGVSAGVSAGPATDSATAAAAAAAASSVPADAKASPGVATKTYKLYVPRAKDAPWEVDEDSQSYHWKKGQGEQYKFEKLMKAEYSQSEELADFSELKTADGIFCRSQSGYAFHLRMDESDIPIAEVRDGEALQFDGEDEAKYGERLMRTMIDMINQVLTSSDKVTLWGDPRMVAAGKQYVKHLQKQGQKITLTIDKVDSDKIDAATEQKASEFVGRYVQANGFDKAETLRKMPFCAREAESKPGAPSLRMSTPRGA